MSSKIQLACATLSKFENLVVGVEDAQDLLASGSSAKRGQTTATGTKGVLFRMSECGYPWVFPCFPLVAPSRTGCFTLNRDDE